MQTLPEGLIVIVKRACPTCTLIEPVLDQLSRGGIPLTVIAQDEADFQVGEGTQVLDTDLGLS